MILANQISGRRVPANHRAASKYQFEIPSKEKERNERDLRNRSTSVSLEDLQNEFRETIMNEENCFRTKLGLQMFCTRPLIGCDLRNSRAPP